MRSVTQDPTIIALGAAGEHRQAVVDALDRAWAALDAAERGDTLRFLDAVAHVADAIEAVHFFNNAVLAIAHDSFRRAPAHAATSVVAAAA